ncbi:alcohol dehydrogenase catalytic domain-containing protein [Micromonospora musae]|uniref:alcohol dehydrogenase catalytic domain-containing protein n=1 Tax=Micromonospora musae TaxID=1894970 RepID=UPI0034315B14
MRAIILVRTGEANGYELRSLPDPQPAPGQVRIRMAGAGVNPADLHMIDDWARGEAGVDAGHPMGLGLDVAGVVDMVGSNVRGLSVGSRVAALTLPHARHAAAGTAAEYVIVPAADVAPVPETLDLLDAATVPLNSLTADQLLARLGPADGRRLLVTGAAGGVGGYAVALAARDGWAVTALGRSTDAGFLGRAGARDLITDLHGVGGFDAVLDAALLNERALRAVRDNGSYVGVFPGLEPESERGITIETGVVVPDGRRLRDMLALSAQGDLEARRAGTVPLAEAARAYDALRGGRQRGRWVLTP